MILDDESAYNVEVQAAFPLGMTTVPSPIKVNIGEYITSFILSCDQRVQPAIYEIEWTASGDWEGE